MAAKRHKQDSAGERHAAAQRSMWSDFEVVSAVWTKLAEQQRQAWNENARSNRRGRRPGQERRLSGYSQFMKVNLRRRALGQELLTEPPGAENPGPFPLVRFFITNIGGRIALKLVASSSTPEYVMLYSWHPCSAGAIVWHGFVRIGPVPAAVRGVRDFTKLYVAKFGVPPVGRKILIRLRRMDDYYGGMTQTVSAMVPSASKRTS